jgi:hypothetical protein
MIGPNGKLTRPLDRAIPSRMQTTYLSIYRVRGVIGLPDDLPVQLLEAPANKAVAQLTMNRDPYFLHLRRIQAFSLMFNQALVGGHENLENASARFLHALAACSISEGTDFDKPLLIVAITGEAEILRPDRAVDVGEISFGLGLFETQDLARCAEAVLEAAVAGISLSLSPSTTSVVTKLGHVAYAKGNDSGRLSYALEMSASAYHSIMTSISKEILTEASNLSNILFAKDDLKTVSHLLSRSLRTTDDLQAFLTAWAALEILVAKSFKSTYEPKLYETLGKTTAAGQFLTRVRDVMKDKYNSRDKFVVVSSSLDASNSEQDIQEFKDIKSERDGIHEMKLKMSGYPTHRVQNLLRKSLRLHLLALK